MRKCLVFLLILAAALYAAGCSKKTNSVNPINQNVKDLLDSYQKDMVTFYDFKNIQDSPVLLTQINEHMRKIEEGKKRLEQLSGITETLTDEKVKAELLNFIDLGREREKLAIKYLNDIRQDLDYKYQNPDADVNINAYIANIPNQLLDLEYMSVQSTRRLNLMLSKK
jgi:nitrous oxide reductase accessory protein NosL